MKVGLVAMPWMSFDAPSAALGCLAAFVAREEPRISVECRNDYLSLWNRIPQAYEAVSSMRSIGDLVYAVQLHCDSASQGELVVEEALARTVARADRRNDGPVTPSIKGDVLRMVLASVQDHLEDVAKDIAGTFDVIGLTTSFVQLFSSLCLAKRVKEPSAAL